MLDTYRKRWKDQAGRVTEAGSRKYYSLKIQEKQKTFAERGYLQALSCVIHKDVKETKIPSK
jgi:hypothetical protein